METISQIKVGNEVYNIEDTTARQEVSSSANGAMSTALYTKLNDLPTNEELENDYAKQSDLDNYAKQSDLDDCIKKSDNWNATKLNPSLFKYIDYTIDTVTISATTGYYQVNYPTVPSSQYKLFTYFILSGGDNTLRITGHDGNQLYGTINKTYDGGITIRYIYIFNSLFQEQN